jgi:hypothetical protein
MRPLLRAILQHENTCWDFASKTISDFAPFAGLKNSTVSGTEGGAAVAAGILFMT